MKRLLFLLICWGFSTALLGNTLDSIPVLFHKKSIHQVKHLQFEWKEGDKVVYLDYWYPAELDKQLRGTDPHFLDKTRFSDLIGRQQTPRPGKSRTEEIKDRLFNSEDLGFPVLVFFSDMGMDRFFNAKLYEKLAGHGFIVVSIDRDGDGKDLAIA